MDNEIEFFKRRVDEQNLQDKDKGSISQFALIIFVFILLLSSLLIFL